MDIWQILEEEAVPLTALISVLTFLLGLITLIVNAKNNISSVNDMAKGEGNSNVQAGAGAGAPKIAPKSITINVGIASLTLHGTDKNPKHRVVLIDSLGSHIILHPAVPKAVFLVSLLLALIGSYGVILGLSAFDIIQFASGDASNRLGAPLLPNLLIWTVLALLSIPVCVVVLIYLRWNMGQKYEARRLSSLVGDVSELHTILRRYAVLFWGAAVAVFWVFSYFAVRLCGYVFEGFIDVTSVSFLMSFPFVLVVGCLVMGWLGISLLYFSTAVEEYF